ncbi:MAG: 50S ribosomal protein L14 [Candidatus Dojkabacteria bacterium]|nr:50S ribosomal protein L14 [Candidatus Dojkabacteria bacterium]
MIQALSVLKVADNTGIKEIKVIQILGSKKGGMFRKFGTVGDLVSASVTKVIPSSTFKKGDKVHAVIVRTKKEIRRKDGTYLRFSENAAVIVNKSTKEPKGTRVFGPVARELKDKMYTKLISLAPEVL